MGKRGSRAVACPDSLSLGAAAPRGDTHLLSSMRRESFSALWFCLGRNARGGHSISGETTQGQGGGQGEPSSF